ncbi:MAG: YfiM family protein [Proteobacteria bacterium]|nr:YfiM family protein [Pseudomonadota bacterium]MBU1583324.1 YfiM family protein [Pseudomonadota bacterium]MBU2630137.1 YfiM family protein [Pseudomonadota bacterium]
MQSFLKQQTLKIYFFVFLMIILFPPLNLQGNETGFSKKEKVVVSNLIGLTTITTWGILNWDYFQNNPKKADEGWFSDNTKSGGQDKLGHFYFSYSLSHILSAIYEDSGYSCKKGAFLGALSSLGMASWMEIGDAFSSYGFSYEDFIMNLIGSTTGYFLYTHPEISNKIDFRIEYRPDFSKTDFSTDYDHQKFLAALKFDGFDFAKKNALKYFELHLGYYTRGYPDKINRERNIYIGLGINVSRLFKQLSMPKTSKILNYIQIPYTYIETNKDLNR